MSVIILRNFPLLASRVSVVLITIILPGSISSYFIEMTYSCFSFLAPEGAALGGRLFGSWEKRRSGREVQTLGLNIKQRPEL